MSVARMIIQDLKAKANQGKRLNGKRYSLAQRKAILDYVEKVGHGGVAAAKKKFGVSQGALSRWVRNGVQGKPMGRPKKLPSQPSHSPTSKESKAALQALRVFYRALHKVFGKEE